MYIDNAGKVGIGTSVPAGILHLDEGAADDCRIIAETHAGGDSMILFSQGASGSGTPTWGIGLDNDNDQLSIGFEDTGYNSFSLTGDSKLVIGTAGQIGIGGANFGSDGQVLTSTGTGSAPAWEDAGGGAAYSAWTIQTATLANSEAAASGDQIICNHASTAITVKLPASPSAGDTVIIKNVGAALVTVGRSSQNIDGAGEDATMPTGNAAQLVYVDTPIGWTVL